MTPRDKIKETAQKYLLKGQADKALVEYERLLADAPRDLHTLLKVGDLRARLGQKQQAIAAYLEVADQHNNQGFSLKAVAVLKQVLALEPTHSQAGTTLAKLYEQLGLISEATAQLHSLVEQLHARKQWPEAAWALERLTALEGEQPATLLLAAEMYQQQGEMLLAKGALERSMVVYREANQLSAWAQAGERLLALDPELAGLACELARYHLHQNDPRRALMRLQVAFRAAPQDTETLTLLAQVFEALDQVPKAVAVLHELAQQAQARSQTHALKRVLEHIVRIDTNDTQAKLALAQLTQNQAAQATVHVVDPSRSQTSNGPANLRKLLVEAQIFARYNLNQRAIDYLDRILSAFPGHPEAMLQRDSLMAKLATLQSAVPRSLQQEPSKDAAAAETVSQAPPTASKQAPDAEPVFALKVAEEELSIASSSTLLRATTVGSQPDLHLDLDLDINLDELIAAALPDLSKKPADGPQTDATTQPPVSLTPHMVPPGNADIETYMELGAAYLEVGLYEDALAQFDRGAASPLHRIDAHGAAAGCLVALGRYAQALARLEQTLEEPQLTTKQTAYLLYEQGRAYEGLGQLLEARRALAKVQAIDPSFRDTDTRLRALAQRISP